MQKFWRILRKIFTIAGILAGIALFVVVLTSAVQKQQQLTCKNVQVKIDYESGLALINEEEVLQRLNVLSSGKLVGRVLSEIDFHTLETELEKNPYVYNSEVFTNQKQEIVVQIVQKRPILRVINNNGVSYYIGENSERIPLHRTFTPHVAVALGNVECYKDTKRDSAMQAALYNLIQFVRKDDFLNALVDQVYVTQENEIEIIPVSGMHTICFGKADDRIEEKFNRLKIFYKEGLSKVGWNKYKSIDLKYNNQVVCEKNDTTNAL